MTPFDICTVIGIIYVCVTALLTRRSAFRRKIQKMSEEDLVRSKVTSGFIWKFGFAMSFVIPVIFVLMASTVPDSRETLLCIMVLVMMLMVGASAKGLATHLETKAELEIRDRKQNQTATQL